ncbi:hypothetical protein L9F63_010443 [Diploptera punctata]|uniref:Clip domain-containing protein n=1 Tax=Diploptera punctata TaxID=6984 RepID=A0AAD8AHA8_DIPPU|nr:hypothetical protein L9F63_010443 [Diploptera punctata]
MRSRSNSQFVVLPGGRDPTQAKMSPAALLLILLFATARSQSAKNPCVNPRGQEGTCINIKQCAELIEMLRNQRNEPGVADFLRASACGFDGRDPKVCCATGPPPKTNITPRVKIPDESECGFTGKTVNEIKVIGGFPAPLGAWPWIVALGYRSKTSPEPRFLCGGALITSGTC